MQTPRRMIKFTSRPNRYVMKGISSYRQRPLIVMEQGDRGRVLLDYDMALRREDRIVAMQLGNRYCHASLRFLERKAELTISGVTPQYYAITGYDYGLDPIGAVVVTARVSSGDDITTKFYVRAPNKASDWDLHRVPGNHNVTDLRPEAVYTGAGEPTISIDDLINGQFTGAPAYAVISADSEDNWLNADTFRLDELT